MAPLLSLFIFYFVFREAHWEHKWHNRIQFTHWSTISARIYLITVAPGITPPVLQQKHHLLQTNWPAEGTLNGKLPSSDYLFALYWGMQ